MKHINRVWNKWINQSYNKFKFNRKNHVNENVATDNKKKLIKQ